MKKNLLSKAICLVALIVIVFVTSCNNDETGDMLENATSEFAGIRVSRVGEWVTVATRAPLEPTLNPDAPILIFDDTLAYNNTIKKLREMTEPQRQKFYAEIGFESASLLLDWADDELDDIFELEVDSVTFVNEIKNYREKYNGPFKFNKIDTLDITPALRFKDPNLALVSNIDGLVVIGDSLITPKDDDENIGSANNSPFRPSHGMVNINNVHYTEITSPLKTKKGKYTSSITMGFDEESGWYVVKTVTKKKRWIFKKKVKTRHFAYISFSNEHGSIANTITVSTTDKYFGLLPWEILWNKTNVNMSISGFHSEKCPNPVSQTFYGFDFR